MDRERLIETFEAMGFDIVTREDLTHSELLDSVERVTRENFRQEHSCFVLCVMSHGVQGKRPRGKESTGVRITQNKGKESENSYHKLKRSQKRGTQKHTET